MTLAPRPCILKHLNDASMHFIKWTKKTFDIVCCFNSEQVLFLSTSVYAGNLCKQDVARNSWNFLKYGCYAQPTTMSVSADLILEKLATSKNINFVLLLSYKSIGWNRCKIGTWQFGRIDRLRWVSITRGLWRHNDVTIKDDFFTIFISWRRKTMLFSDESQTPTYPHIRYQSSGV